MDFRKTRLTALLWIPLLFAGTAIGEDSNRQPAHGDSMVVRRLNPTEPVNARFFDARTAAARLAQPARPAPPDTTPDDTTPRRTDLPGTNDPELDLSPPDPLAPDPPEDDMLAQAPDAAQPPPFSALLLASVPNMIGDFFGVSGAQVAVTGPVAVSVQRSGNLLVTNANGGIGADMNPTVPIQVTDTTTMTPFTGSIGPGTDFGGRIVYPSSEPSSGAPPPPAEGSVTFTDGNIAFTGTGNPVGNGTDWTVTSNYLYTPDNQGQVVFLVPPVGGAVTRRVKLAENNSPRPRNRLFFNYNFFNDVIAGLGDVSRYTAGFESTYWDERGSFEFRAPLAGTMASTQSITALNDRDAEFGNLSLIWKHILFETDDCLISAGAGVNMPTADDTRVMNGEAEMLRINNQAWHVLPFVAMLGTPTDRCFWQAFVQLDIDTNGNAVFGDLAASDLPKIGVFNDATLMFFDVGAGYHIYQNPYAPLLRRVSALAEIHYATTVQDEDVVSGNGLTVGGLARRFDVVDLTFGAGFIVGDHTSLRPAMVIPLSQGVNRHFDFEATLQVNVFF